MKTSLVIPTRNEVANLPDILNASYGKCDEILIVDGHSDDGTREFAEQRGVRVILDHGKGKGDGLRLALREARGDIVVFMDADGSHDPEDIPRLVDPILRDETDLVIGSRMRGGSDELHGDLRKFIRMLGSDIITLSINYRFGVRLTDCQNGFRAIRRRTGLEANLTEDIFTIEQEMIMKVLKKGGRVAEIPTHEYESRNPQSSIVVWKVAHRYVWCLLKNLV